MERWWGQSYDRAALAALYGGLDARPLPATLERGRAHEQAVALATLGAAHVTAAAPAVARQLVNPFPLVRYYARRALEALRGQECARRSRSADAGDRGGGPRLRPGGVRGGAPVADGAAPARAATTSTRD